MRQRTQSKSSSGFCVCACFGERGLPDRICPAVDIATANPGKGWNGAEDITPIKSKRYVVTIDQPDRKQSCHVKSFTDDELVCSRAIGGLANVQARADRCF